MYAPGNKSLYSLNLSSNKIGNDGLYSLLKMLEEHYEAEVQLETHSTSLIHLKLDNNLSVSCIFLTISQLLYYILTERIESIGRLDCNLFFDYICSIRVCSRNREIVETVDFKIVLQTNFQFNSAMRDHPKYSEIVSGIDGLFATSKTSIPRLDDIKED